MKIANISTLKNQLSKYLKYVQQGERVRICDRNKVIAEIIPVGLSPTDKDSESQISRLESQGLIRRPPQKWTDADLKSIEEGLLDDSPSHGILDALLEDRKSGR